jgi:hypothetical protein
MTDQSENLIAQIRALDEGTALEAAQLLSGALGAQATPTIAGQDVLERPLEHRDDIGDLCRVLLIVAASDSKTRELVEESLAGAGRKQLVLSGPELVTLGFEALGALQVFYSKGRTKQEETLTIKKNPDGSEETIVQRTVRYGISAKLAELLKAAIHGL